MQVTIPMAVNTLERKVVILGSGRRTDSGYYASRAQLEPLVIDGPHRAAN